MDAEFISLQRDTGLDQLPDFPSLVDNANNMPTLMDTLSIINNCDIIVTSCTSIAHMSAALGKRTIVLTPISAYYTWAFPGDKCPWYGDNLTLLRQEKPRDWKIPLRGLKNLLK